MTAIFMALTLLFGAGVVAKSVISVDHRHDSQFVVNHGGGLDKCGGHNDRKRGGYHYHQGPYC